MYLMMIELARIHNHSYSTPVGGFHYVSHTIFCTHSRLFDRSALKMFLSYLTFSLPSFAFPFHTSIVAPISNVVNVTFILFSFFFFFVYVVLVYVNTLVSFHRINLDAWIILILWFLSFEYKRSGRIFLRWLSEALEGTSEWRITFSLVSNYARSFFCH